MRLTPESTDCSESEENKALAPIDSLSAAINNAVAFQSLIAPTITKMVATFSDFLSSPAMQEACKMAQVASEALERIANYDFSRIAEAARQALAGVSEIVKNITIPTISEERKQELIDSHKRWGSFGWTINPVASVDTLFDCAPLNKKEADRAALKYCDNAQMDSLFETTLKDKRVRRADYEEAVENFKSKHYKSCALMLFSLTDAKLIRLQKGSALQGKRRKVGAGAVKSAKDRATDKLTEHMLFSLLYQANIFSCMEKMFEDGKDFKAQPVVINRNFIDHGMLTRRTTRKDCIQLFLLYYNLLELLDWIYR